MYSHIFIISGPSGAGEDSIINGLSAMLPTEKIINTTTRSEMRPGESQGNPYYFITHEAFAQGIENGEFMEYAKLHNGNFYGVTRTELDRVSQSNKIGIWKMDYKGVMSIKKLFPEIQAVLITAPSLEILEARIRRRGDVAEEYIKERMEYTKEWMKHTDIYDYIVVNEEGRLKEAIETVRTIVQKEL